MNTNKYLPIGTVVLLRNAKKKIMITGFAVRGKESGTKMYDYSGCLYPEGVLASDQNLLFDHDRIEKIYYMGYASDEESAFKAELNKLVAELNNQNVQTQTVPSFNNAVDNNVFQQSNTTVSD